MIKLAKRLVLIAIFIFGLTGSAVAGELWWAVATGYKVPQFGPDIPVEVYGAAWNFPTYENAVKAAIDECKKKWSPCGLQDAGANSCFAVGQFEKQGFYRHVKPYAVMYQETRAKLVELIKRQKSDHLLGTFNLSLLKCSGAK